MSTTIEDRFTLILREQATRHDEESANAEQSLWSRVKMWRNPPKLNSFGMWETLNEWTGIPAQRWRSAYNKRQKPTLEMIEAVAHIWPQYSFWLVTGITDSTNGHTGPVTAFTFPERLYAQSPWAEQYFNESIELSKTLYKNAEIDTKNEKQRMFAVERTRPFAHWIASPLINTAHKLSTSTQYKELQKTWLRRENERPAEIDRITGKNRPWLDQADSAVRYPNFGRDPRSTHQDLWDLFFTSPKESSDSKK